MTLAVCHRKTAVPGQEHIDTQPGHVPDTLQVSLQVTVPNALQQDFPTKEQRITAEQILSCLDPPW